MLYGVEWLRVAPDITTARRSPSIDSKSGSTEKLLRAQVAQRGQKKSRRVGSTHVLLIVLRGTCDCQVRIAVLRPSQNPPQIGLGRVPLKYELVPGGLEPIRVFLISPGCEI